ncbi:MAG: tRNA pseudouridine(55) synthase TruB [Myxococcales bacterium]|nr:tRNA pseudouridine(55) synthase TruB [Myxococcales bacterium]
MLGLLVLDKPEGLTSFDLVARARRRFGTRRIGHTGTLDPMATGVLPLCIGEATRIAQFLSCDDKVYEATVALGASTDTQDRMGRVMARAPVPCLTRGDVEAALDRFRGDIEQVPPMFSAIRVNGERLYDMARRGESVARAARRVTIQSLELLSFEGEHLALRVACSKGTYIRTLAHDLGERLGCHAHLTALRRLRAGRFGLGEAITLDELMSLPDEALQARLISERHALSDLPEVLLGELDAWRVLNGQKLSVSELPAIDSFCSSDSNDGRRPLRLTSRESGQLLAVAECRQRRLHYLRVFPRTRAVVSSASTSS